MTSISILMAYILIALFAGLFVATLATALPKFKDYTRQQVRSLIRDHQMSVTLNRIKHQASARHCS
jgi:hypothetical protein